MKQGTRGTTTWNPRVGSSRRLVRAALVAALAVLAGAPARAAVGDRFWDSCPVDSTLVLTSCTNPNPATGLCGVTVSSVHGSYGWRASCPWYVVGVTNVPGERVTLSTSMSASVRAAVRAVDPQPQGCARATADLRLVRNLGGTLYEIVAELRVQGEWDANDHVCRFPPQTTLHTYQSVWGDRLRVLGRTTVDGFPSHDESPSEVMLTANHGAP